MGSRFRREVFITALASVGVYSLGLLSSPILARALGPSGRGEVAAVLSPAFMIAWLLPFGLPLAAAYYVDTVPEGRLISTATVFGLTAGSAACAILWFLAPAYLSNHSDTALVWARILIVLLPLNVGVQTVLEIRRRRSADVGWNAWRSAPQALPVLLIVILALSDSLTVGTALAAYLIGSLIPLPLLISRIRASHDRRPSLATLRRVMPYAWRTAATSSTTSVTARLDQVVLAATVSSGRLGLYVVAVTAASVTNPLTTGLSLALFGHLRDDTSAAQSAARFRRSLSATLALSAAVALLTALLAPPILRIAFGSEFEGATGALRLLLPGAVALNVLNVLGTKLEAEGRPGETSRAAALGAVLTLAGIGLTVPTFGILGAAATTSVAYLAELVYLARRGALRMPEIPDAPPDAGVIPTGTELTRE